ncbi:MAG: exo-alpha-sialidase [Thermoflexales bacterium]|nr:exo-alpha-sialidase [Thermoflexales bacterium]
MKRLVRTLPIVLALAGLAALLGSQAASRPALADAPWNGGVRVNDTSAPAPGTVSRTFPSLAASPVTSDVYAVWVDDRSGYDSVYFATSADGGRTWGPSRRVSNAGATASAPDIAYDPAGPIHVVWYNGFDIYYARSTDDGRSWIEPLVVDSGYNLGSPAIAVLTDTVCIAWSDGRLSPAPGIYADCSFDGGHTWGTDARVSDDTAGLLSHYHPDIAISSSGRLHVAWDEVRVDAPDIYYAYSDDGSTWSANARLNRDLVRAYPQESPALAVDRNSVYAVWKDGRSGSAEVYFNHSTDAGLAWQAADQVVNDAGAVSDEPALAVSGDGMAWATWRVISGTQSILYADKRDTSWGRDGIVVASSALKQHLALAAGGDQLYTAWSDSSDIALSYREGAWSAPIQVNDEGVAIQTMPVLATGSTGNLYAVWSDNRVTNTALYVARSTDGGQSWSANTQVGGSLGAIWPALAVQDAITLHVAWRLTEGAVWQAWYNSSPDGGQSWETARLIAGNQADGNGETPNSPALAVYSGTVYAAWPSQGQLVLAQSGDGGGNWVTSTLPFTPTVRGRPTLAADPAGRLHLAWEYHHQDGHGDDVCYARSGDGGAVWEDLACFSDPSSAILYQQPQLAVEPLGSCVHLVWTRAVGEQRRSSTAVLPAHVYYSVSNDSGASWGGGRQLDTGYRADSPVLAAVDDGVVYAAWRNERVEEDVAIYWARTADGGASWQYPARVDSGFGIHYPALAANYAFSNTAVWAGWQDSRGNSDVYVASLMAECPVPLDSVSISGDSTVAANQALTLTGAVSPTNATGPLGHYWDEPNNPPQDGQSASFTWAYGGHYTVTYRVAACSGVLAAQHAVTVPCPYALTDLSISGAKRVMVGEYMDFSAVVTPAMSDVTLAWQTDAPGDGHSVGKLAWRYTFSTVGQYTITATAYSCGSAEWGAVSGTHQIEVYDDVPPRFLGGISPYGWVTQTLPGSGYIVPFTATVWDSESGLDVGSAQASFSEDGGASWNAWEPVSCTGSSGMLDSQTITGQNAFRHDSGAAHLNRLRLRLADVAGNMVTGTFNIDLDTTPPTNPSSIVVDRPVRTWSNDYWPDVTWVGAGDGTYPNELRYAYAWTRYPTTTIPGDISCWWYADDSPSSTGMLNCEASASASGQNFHLHTRVQDAAGWWAAGQAPSVGPYWLDMTHPSADVDFISSPPTNECINDNTVTLAWNRPADEHSGVNAYAYRWTTVGQDPLFSPDMTTTASVVTVTGPALSDYFVYSFTLRSRDVAGNWSGVDAIGPFLIDAHPPSTPTIDSTYPHETGVWSADNTVEVRWTSAYTGQCGTNAHSFVWNTAPGTVPDTNPELLGAGIYTRTTSAELADGEHYFHVRSRDAAGNWSGSAHVGPFRIDTTPPPPPVINSSDPVTSAWTSDNTVYVYVRAAPDDGGSLARDYSYAWNSVPVTDVDTTVDTTAAPGADLMLFRSLPDGPNYLHIRVGDEVGHWSGTTHYGPFLIDATPPPPPVIAYSDPVSKVWTSDNVIDVYWDLPPAAARVVFWSYEWSTDEATDPDTTADSPTLATPTQFKATSPALLNGSNHYFHIRAQDLAGNWGETTHYGPFLVDNTPPLLIAYNESGAPGSDALLLGLVFPPNVDATLYFVEGGNYQSLGTIRTSIDGTFQALATVPLNALQGPHRFRATAGAKVAEVAFNVTRGMVMSVQPSPLQLWYAGTRPLEVTLNDLNPNGDVVIETDWGTFKGPFSLDDQTSLITDVQVSLHDAISGTHTLTATTRIAGVVVQRAAATYIAHHPQPPEFPEPSYIELDVNRGQRGTLINVSGLNRWKAELECGSSWREMVQPLFYNPDEACVFVEYDLQWLTGDNASTIPEWNADNSFDMDAFGFFTGQVRVYDGWENPEPDGPQWDVSKEMPWGEYSVCLFAHMWTMVGDVSDWWLDVPINCVPFTVEPPDTAFTAQYAFKDQETDQYIALSDTPRMIVSGERVDYVNNSPVAERETFAPTAENTPAAVSLPEGNYQYTAFACRYEPATNEVYMRGRGEAGLKTIELKPTDLTGPGVLGVSANTTTFLGNDYADKIGPFLSFVNPNNGTLLAGAPAAQVTFDIEVPLPGEASVTQISVTVAGEAKTTFAISNGHASISWDMSTLPAGEVKMYVQAYGHYEGAAECGSGDAWGPPHEMTILMAAAPPWLYNDAWVEVEPAELSYNSSGDYELHGRLKGSIEKYDNTDLGMLGVMNNGVRAEVAVTHTFDVLSGIWTADADVFGGADLMCYTVLGQQMGGCGESYSLHFTAIPDPSGGPVDSIAVPSFPSGYSKGVEELLTAEVGPIEVYNGLLATYLGVVNVHLSINFGAEAALDITPALAGDLTPDITLTPSATINGTVSLWVDVLGGIASAGVDAIPSLTLSMPINIRPPEVTVEGPNVCFRLSGRVWVKALFWSDSFGPFTLMELGDCTMAELQAQALATPPSTLPAPALATDGYGHVLGAWVHDVSNDPLKSQGVLYSVYFDGANWGEQVEAAGSPSLLVTDPAIAFAGNTKAVAVFAANALDTTQAETWNDVVEQLSTQAIAYTVWNGSTWSAPATLASGEGEGLGRVALAGDPAHGRALAAWVHDQSPTSSISRPWWFIEYSWFDAATNTWSPPKALSNPGWGEPLGGETDAEVSLAFRSDGFAKAVWVRQSGVFFTPPGDSPFNNNYYRTLVVATWNPNTDVWTIDEPLWDLPRGALMPSIAFDDQDRPVLAYALYLKDRDGATDTGLGNNNYLGYAIRTSSSTWLTDTVPGVRGVEQPRLVMLPEDQAAIVYRGFGEPGTDEANGVAMVTVVDLLATGSQATLPGALTGGNSWMHAAVALKPKHSSSGLGGQATLMTLGTYNLGGPPAQARAAGASMQNVSMQGDQVFATNVPVLPDLSVSAQDIVVTQTLPLSGTLVPISVTVRNRGLARTHQLVVVRVIQDENGLAEQEIMSATIPAGLMFNGTYQLAGTWRALSGYHELAVRVSPPITDDVDGGNNEATLAVGVPATPADLAGSFDALHKSVGISWLPVSGPAMSHYQVYRAEGAGELVRLATASTRWFRDEGVQVGTTYTYAVSAVSDARVESPKSAPVSLTIAWNTVYLPVVMR